MDKKELSALMSEAITNMPPEAFAEIENVLKDVENLTEKIAEEVPNRSFDVFRKNVLKWSEDRGILKNGTLEGQTLKFCEEAGEVAGAVAKGNQELLIDSVGDTLVTLINVCAIADISIEDCMDKAWYEIKDRTGYLTESGVFVKEN